MKKQVNAELVEFAKAARERGMTYGQLQAQQTIQRLMVENARNRKARKEKKSNEREKVSTASREAE